MSQEDTNLENELEEAAEGEEIQSGLKIRTNLKAGAISLASRVATGSKGDSWGDAIAISPYIYDINVAAIKY